jgi:hypothetical protein
MIIINRGSKFKFEYKEFLIKNTHKAIQLLSSIQEPYFLNN